MIDLRKFHLLLDNRTDLVLELVADIGSEIGYTFDEYDVMTISPIISFLNQYCELLEEIKQLVKQADIEENNSDLKRLLEALRAYNNVLVDDKVSQATINLLFRIISSVYEDQTPQFQFFEGVIQTINTDITNHNLINSTINGDLNG